MSLCRFVALSLCCFVAPSLIATAQRMDRLPYAEGYERSGDMGLLPGLNKVGIACRLFRVRQLTRDDRVFRTRRSETVTAVLAERHNSAGDSYHRPLRKLFELSKTDDHDAA